MRIAVLGPMYPLRGGIAHFTENTIRELRASAEVLPITFSRQYPEFLFPGRTQLDESGRFDDVGAEVLLDSIGPLSWLRVRRRLRQFQPDAVLFNWWQPFFAPCYGSIALAQEPRTVLLAHNVLSHERRRAEELLVRSAFRLMDRVVLLSRETEALACRVLPPERLVRLFHPVYSHHADSPTWTRESARASLGLSPIQPVALFFGYIRSYKGVLALLNSWRQLAVPEAHLLIVGEVYDDREAISALLQEPSLQGRVTLVDAYVPNEDIARYFLACDCVVLPYERASQSGVGNTAIAFAKPMVVTEVGALPELVAGGSCGESAPLGDGAALTAALTRCLERGSTAYAEGLAAAAEATSWQRFGQELLRVLLNPLS